MKYVLEFNGSFTINVKNIKIIDQQTLIKLHVEITKKLCSIEGLFLDDFSESYLKIED